MTKKVTMPPEEENIRWFLEKINKLQSSSDKMPELFPEANSIEKLEGILEKAKDSEINRDAFLEKEKQSFANKKPCTSCKGEKFIIEEEKLHPEGVNQVRQTCTECGGDGFTINQISGLCPECKGQGHFCIEGVVNYGTCPTCKGTGKAMEEKLVYCSNCKHCWGVHNLDTKEDVGHKCKHPNNMIAQRGNYYEPGELEVKDKPEIRNKNNDCKDYEAK